MSSLPRATRTASHTLRRSTQIRSRTQPTRIPRRQASHGHETFQYDASESALHAKSGAPHSESLGKGFYYTITFVPFFYVTYSLASGDENNAVNQWVRGFLREENDQERNAVHNAIVQQALQDRSLFKNTPRDDRGPDLRFPEALNAGSPWNVVAGEGTADMNELIKSYAERHQAREDARNSRFQGQRVLTVYDEQHAEKAEVKSKSHNKATV